MKRRKIPKGKEKEKKMERGDVEKKKGKGALKENIPIYLETDVFTKGEKKMHTNDEKRISFTFFFFLKFFFSLSFNEAIIGKNNDDNNNKERRRKLKVQAGTGTGSGTDDDLAFIYCVMI